MQDETPMESGPVLDLRALLVRVGEATVGSSESYAYRLHPSTLACAYDLLSHWGKKYQVEIEIVCCQAHVAEQPNTYVSMIALVYRGVYWAAEGQTTREGMERRMRREALTPHPGGPVVVGWLDGEQARATLGGQKDTQAWLDGDRGRQRGRPVGRMEFLTHLHEILAPELARFEAQMLASGTTSGGQVSSLARL